MSLSYSDITGSTDLSAVLSGFLTPGVSLVAGSVTYQGIDGQGSVFSGGLDTIGLDNGILLTSGDGSPANSNTDTNASLTTNSGANAALDAATATPSFDANAIGFSINVTDPAITQLTFSFVFGSEEYPEYVDQFPDLGVIMVNGVNYAKFANGNVLTVTSANLAAGNFQDNTDGHIAIEYDGISTKLTVTVPLNAGVNEILLAAGDLNDTALDSGLFIGQMTFNSGDGGGDGGGTINAAPLPVDDAYNGTQNNAISVNASNGVLANDADPDGDALTAALVSGTSHGSVVLNGDGSFVYTPTAGFNGIDSFTYSASDGNGGVTNATVDLTITGTVTPPGFVGTKMDDFLVGTTGNDEIRAKAGNDTVDGGTGDDFITGDAGDDLIYAGKGNDRVDGGADNDVIYGRAGDDILRGGGGNDRIVGDTGNDRIYGDAGNDSLAGGAGMDIFVFTSGDGDDQITDFTHGEDHINLHATGLGFADLTITSDASGTTIHYGASQIHLAGIASVTADDFIF